MSLTGGWTGRRVAALLVLITALSAGVIAAPSASAAPKPTIEQVRKQIDDLRDQAEVATERYNELQEQIASLTVRLAASRTKVAEQQKSVAIARQEVGRVAADTYKAGDLATLSLFLGDDPDRYLQANGLMVSLGDRRANAVGSLHRQQQSLVATMTDVEEQQQKLQQAEKEVQVTRVEIQKKLSQETLLLGQLSASDRTALNNSRVTKYNASFADLGIKVPANGQVTCDDIPVVAPNARAGKALTYACSHLGDPYVWGGAGPSSFDCSGLTQMAWKQAGVSLPHNAAMQFGYGTKVSQSQLQAGDLVFFHSPPTHVAIYVGNGVMLHAPQTGDVVRLVPLRQSGYSGAVRL